MCAVVIDDARISLSQIGKKLVEAAEESAAAHDTPHLSLANDERGDSFYAETAHRLARRIDTLAIRIEQICTGGRDSPGGLFETQLTQYSRENRRVSDIKTVDVPCVLNGFECLEFTLMF